MQPFICLVVARRKTNNDARSLLVLRAVRRHLHALCVILNAICTNMETPSRNNRCRLFLLNLHLKSGTTLITSNLQSRLSELLKIPLSTTAAPSSGKISATTSNFWQSCNRIRGVLSVCQTRWKSGSGFASISKKTVFKKTFSKKNPFAFSQVKNNNMQNGPKISLILV